MEIIRQKDAPVKQLGQEQRWYYQGDQLRIVITRMPAGHVQNEHRHEELYDVTYVLEGEIEASERANGDTRTENLAAGDLVVFEPGPFHNVANRSDVHSLMLTLKIARQRDLHSTDFERLCETDWTPLEDKR